MKLPTKRTSWLSPGLQTGPHFLFHKPRAVEGGGIPYPRWLLTESTVCESISNWMTKPSPLKPNHQMLPEQKEALQHGLIYLHIENTILVAAAFSSWQLIQHPLPHDSDNKLHFNLNLVHYSYYNSWAISPFLFAACPLDPLYQLYCFILNKLLGLPGKAFMLSMKMSNTQVLS